jgi:glycosyltransferase involved in cell wall biosynthesis
VHVVPFPYAIRPPSDLAALVRLWRFFRRERFDVVHTYGSKAGFLVRTAARLAGCPVVAHSAYVFHFRKFPAGLRRAAFIWIERLAARYTDALFCSGPVLYREAVAHRLAPPDRLQLIGGPVGDVERFDVAPEEVDALRAELGLTPGTPVVACACRLVAYKGVDTLLRAARRVIDAVPETRLVITGNGPLERELRALADSLGIADRVTFTGFRVDGRDVLRLLAMATAFCLPTRYDAYPIAFTEAMAMGCPAVGPRMDAVEAIVEDGVTGMLVEPENEGAYAAALVRLLRDPGLRARQSQAARARFRDRLDPRPTYETVTLTYQRLLKSA